MKVTPLIIIFLFFFVNLSFTQKETTLGLSFRPSFQAINYKASPFETPTTGAYSTNQRRITSFEFLMHVEFSTKKNFYHFPIIGGEYTQVKNTSERFLNAVIESEENSNLVFSNIYAGYGIGKYFYIYKEDLFINLRNSLAFGYALSKSTSSFDYVDPIRNIEGQSANIITQPSVYKIMYELNPSLGYRINWFSISLGFPVQLGLEIVDGVETRERTFYDFNILSQRTDINKEKRNSTSFLFRYDLELSLRFHLPHKKKETK